VVLDVVGVDDSHDLGLGFIGVTPTDVAGHVVELTGHGVLLAGRGGAGGRPLHDLVTLLLGAGHRRTGLPDQASGDGGRLDGVHRQLAVVAVDEPLVGLLVGVDAGLGEHQLPFVGGHLGFERIPFLAVLLEATHLGPRQLGHTGLDALVVVGIERIIDIGHSAFLSHAGRGRPDGGPGRRMGVNGPEPGFYGVTSRAGVHSGTARECHRRDGPNELTS